MTARHSIGAALVVLLALWGPAACGGGEEGASEMPVVNLGGGGGGGGGAPARRAGAPRSTEVTPEMGESVVSEAQFDDAARDPFMREFPEGETPLLPGPEISLEPEEATDLGPLADYSLESLRLQAIITRTPEPRAMFLLPDGSGLAVLARVDDRVGPDGTGRIVDIQPNQVIVSYEGLFEFGLAGEQVRTQVVTLRDPARDIEAEFEPY